MNSYRKARRSQSRLPESQRPADRFAAPPPNAPAQSSKLSPPPVVAASFAPPLFRRVTVYTLFNMAEGIDRNMDDKMEFSTSKEVTVAPTFEAMHLKENLLRGVYAYGYESPSAVQSRAIVQICKGRDTIAQAQSGTGKTATFSISILQVIDTAVRETQGTHALQTSIPYTDTYQHLFCLPHANLRHRSSPWSWVSVTT